MLLALLFLALEAELFFVLEALLLPEARVLAALLRCAAVLELDAMVLAAWLLLAVLLDAELFFVLEAFLLPAAKVLAALLRCAAELALDAMVFAARLLLAALFVDLLLLVGICGFTPFFYFAPRNPREVFIV